MCAGEIMKKAEANEIMRLAHESGISSSWSSGNKYVILNDFFRVGSVEEMKKFLRNNT
jgi:hypothetical protein